MNKFGIFNLINSFYDLYKNVQTSPTAQTTNGTPSSTPQIIPAVSSLLTSLTNKPPTQAPEQKQPQQKPKIPLQQGMLSAMHSHDNFVKKVTAKASEKV